MTTLLFNQCTTHKPNVVSPYARRHIYHTLSKLGSNTHGGFKEMWFVGSFTMVLEANLTKFQNQTISSELDISIFVILIKIQLFWAFEKI
jgi:hypothetical protein